MLKKCSDINNCHLTKETFNSLDCNREPYTYRYPEGVFLTVSDRSVLNLDRCPEDLKRLLSYAWELGITLIHTDRDADTDTDEFVFFEKEFVEVCATEPVAEADNKNESYYYQKEKIKRRTS